MSLNFKLRKLGLNKSIRKFSKQLISVEVRHTLIDFKHTNSEVSAT